LPVRRGHRNVSCMATRRTRTTWDDLLRPGNASVFFDRHPLPVFDPDVATYSPANAWWLAELSRIVYRHDEGESKPLMPSRRSLLDGVGFDTIAFCDVRATNTQALLVQNDHPKKFAVLAFRGTEQTVKDFVNDLSTFPKLVGKTTMRVHSGFLDALDSVWERIAPALSSLDRPLFITGHSLGAALATIAATRTRARAVYTFGSPRVGNDEFVRSLAQVPIYRIVDDADLVTLVPPDEFGFCHVGEVHKLEAPIARRSILTRLQSIGDPPKPLADHAPINYVDRIER
jgi:triacylglycerol lipase